MKDYYYILGVQPEAPLEEIKKAYRKLSTKFHPDKNDGDEFFSERFKEIQEAWEILGNYEKRSEHDLKRFGKSSAKEPVIPEIISFKANKSTYDLNEEITFAWQTKNADKVTLHPFDPSGSVATTGEKTYRIKIINSNTIDVELTAEDSVTQKKVVSLLTLSRRIAQYSGVPKYYTRKAIMVFSIFLSTIFGSVLLSSNLTDKKGKWLVVGFGILYTIVQVTMLNAIPISNTTGLSIGFNVGGATMLNSYFWDKYLGKEVEHQAKPIWKPLIIAIIISSLFLLIIIAGKE